MQVSVLQSHRVMEHRQTCEHQCRHTHGLEKESRMLLNRLELFKIHLQEMRQTPRHELHAILYAWFGRLLLSTEPIEDETSAKP